jgi:single-stranded-DNA-specific exonuclease
MTFAMNPALAIRPVGPPQRTFLNVERSLTGRRWLERLTVEGNANALAMAQRHQIPDIVARVLAGRGVLADEAQAFLSPSIRALMPDPATLTDMDKAAARIADAVIAAEKVAIFGDYDVDGASSSALLARFLRHQGLDPHIYIPDRLFEGYGPNVEAMKSLAAAGAKLVVCVDCGSTSFEALETARALGLSVVVVDHHEVGVLLPQAEAIVNPNRQDDLSGLGYLAAVGVTFLTLVAVNRQLRARGVYASGRIEPDLLQWLDLVALGTICDVVPLVGLNRALVAKGMLALARRENRGIAALADVARLSGPVAPYHLGFVLGPRINAGGRIGDAALGARLLVSDDVAECERIAVELDRLNQERQQMEAAMVEEAVAEAEAEIGSGEGPPVIVTAGQRWHPGVVGLIAARLKERFQRPAIAIAFRANGLGMGSGRSIPGVDLGHAIRSAVERGLLVKGGGHAMAAGLTIEMSRLGELRAYLEGVLRQPVLAHDGHQLEIDAALSARGATVDLIEMVDRAGPFGAGHPEPVFVFPSHRLAYADVVGSGHLRLTLASPDGAMVRAMAFRAVNTPLGAALEKARGQMLHVAGTLSIDAWQEQRRVTLRVLDAAEPASP